MAQQWSQGKCDDVIDQQSRQHTAQHHNAQQQQRRLLGIVAELLVQPGIHTGEIELRADQHQRQQQQQRSGIQMASCLCRRLRTADKQ